MAILCEQCHETVFSQLNYDTPTDDDCDLFSDLEQIDALMGRLRLRRFDLKRQINRRYSPIIRQLPHDVLSVVFSFCLPDHTTFHTSISKFDLSVPLILGAVCKDWRETAWSSPRLWSAIAIISSTGPSLNIRSRLAREWLARSGLLPLSIRIVAPRGTLDMSHLRDFAPLLIPVSSRLHTLHLSAPPQIYHIFCGPHFSAPILESLQFDCGQPQPFIPGQNKFYLAHCPRLQEIRFKNASVHWIRVPMDNLARIYADGLPIEELSGIIQQSPLVHCEFTNIGHMLYVASLGRLSVSTRLQHLTIQVGAADPRLVAHHISDITASCLKTIAISRIDILDLPTDLIHSARSLHTLSLGDTRFSRSDMMWLLGILPTLKHLTVSTPPSGQRSNETDIMLQVLARAITSQARPSIRGFLPNLETLTFTGYQIVQPTKIPHIISTGPWDEPQHHLCSVTLKLYSPIEHLPGEAIPFLLCLKQYGIMLKVCDTSYDEEDLLEPTSLDEVDLDSSLFELESQYICTSDEL